MKILMTGTTKQQVGGGTALGYEPVADLFAKGLRLAGYEVEHRKTTIGEDLAPYDAVLVGLVPFFSIASNQLYHALDVIERAEKSGHPLLFFVDDWAFPRLVANLNTHIRHPWQLTKEFFAGRASYDWACSRKAELQVIVERMRYQPWAPTLVPAFTWGDHHKLTGEVEMMTEPYYIDVSALARDYDLCNVERPRQRRWVLGTVSDQRKWLDSLNLSWEVSHLGTRASKAPEKMPEADLVRLYAGSWGVLSPPYKRILGTGWWRNRAVYAARAGSILLADPGEMPQLGEPYQVVPADVEKMNDVELSELAAAQRNVLFSTQPSAQQVAAQLDSIVQGVINR